MAGKMSPFAFVNSVTYDKNNIFNDETKAQYVPYLINRSLSYFPDTVLYANDLNMFPDMPKVFQYRYYLSSLSKRKRFSPWAKKIDDELVNKISDVYQCNERKASEILSVLSPDQIKALRQLKTGSSNERRGDQ